MKRKFGLPLFFWLMIAALQQFATSEALAMGRGPVLMGAIGDSISAATFADQSASEPINGGENPYTGEKITLDPSLIGVLFSIENKWSLSWTSGNQIDSHYKRLKKALRSQGDKGTVDIWNVAIPGQVAKQTPRQAERLAEAMASGRYEALEYVTFMIGANDACRETDPHALRAEIVETLGILAGIQQKKPIKIMVAGMPNIPSLGRQDLRDHQIPGSKMNCHEVRTKVFGSCRRYLTWTTEEQYQAFVAEVVEKNEAIAAAVQEARERFPNLDLAFSNALFNDVIQENMMAIDCFHPNKIGQSRIAELLWNDQPWYSK